MVQNRTPVSVVNGSNYTCQANYTIVGGDGKQYFVQVVAGISTTPMQYQQAGTLFSCEIRDQPPIAGKEPMFASDFGFDPTLPILPGDLVLLTLDLQACVARGAIMRAGSVYDRFAGALPAQLQGGSIFYVEPLPTGYFDGMAQFSSGTEFDFFVLTAPVLATWKAVPVEMIEGVDYSPCSQCGLGSLTSEDTPLTDEIAPGTDVNQTWEMDA